MTQNKKDIPVFGITGGVGCGKSLVMEILEKDFGGGIILADRVGHELMEPGQVNYQLILQEFGQEILDPQGQIDRQALAAIVFADKTRLDRLNQLTHPPIEKEILDRISRFKEEGKVPFIALEAALLIEGGYEKLADLFWYVSAREDVRIRRLMQDRGYSPQKCRDIMARQLPEEAFLAACPVVIDNNGSIDHARKQVREALAKCGLV